jgi:hypothetical protein
MSNRDNILKFLTNKPDGACDDCVSAKADVSPRQQVNQICNQLQKQGRVKRKLEICSTCNRFKKVNTLLFGNAERLKPPSERGDTFTAKCITAADRVGAALVNTCDLFEPTKYLRIQNDSEYAKACRDAIFQTKGGIVVFPPPPIGTAAEILQGEV